MAKGNHNPVINQQTITEPGENARFVGHNLELAQLPVIDPRNPEQVAQRINDYLGICVKNDMKPNVPGLALAFSVDRTTIWRWANGHINLPTECQLLFKKAYSLLNAFLEDAGISGKINPAAYIFSAKNHFGYRDQTDIVVAPETKEAPSEEVLLAEAKLLDD